VFWLESLAVVFSFVEQNPPINEVVQSGVVPRVVKFLSRDDFPKLQVSRSCSRFFLDILIVTSLMYLLTCFCCLLLQCVLV